MAETISLEADKWMKVEWKIKNIFSDHFVKQQFRLMNGICYLCFYHSPRTCTRHWDEIAISIGMTAQDHQCNTFRIRCFIEDKEKKPQFPYEITRDFTKCWHRDVHWSTRIKDIEKRKKTLVTEGVATFVLMFSPVQSLESKEHKSIETTLPVDSVPSMECLSFDLRRLLDDRAHSDVTLKCEDLTIAAHRAILSARSEVFSAMLRSDMSESREGVITIIDIEAPILVHLVQYIYSGIIPELSDNSAQRLYEAADKYAIQSLKAQCSAFMKENLTKENAFDILVVADAHFDSNLKDSIISFIAHTQHLMDDNWVKFRTDRPSLAEEVHSQAKAAKSSSEEPGCSK